MHDLNSFRTNLETFRQRLATRGFDLDVAAFQTLDQRRRQVVTESEQLKAASNSATAEIGKLRREGVDTTERQAEVRQLAEKSKALDEQVRQIDEEFRLLLAGIPNLPHESVPVGRGADDNVEVRRWGTPREFGFTPKAHWD